MVEVWIDILAVLDGTARLSTPLIFCAMAGLVSERSGIVDIGLEGKLLAGAFAAAAVATLSGSPWAGLAAALASSTVLALVHGFACITHRGEQIISGVAINILALGMTVVVANALFRHGGHTPALGAGERFTPIALPLVESLRTLPLVGSLYAELLSGHNLLVYAAFMSVPLVSWLLWRTRFGLRLRAAGELPEAVDSVGVSVPALRYRGILLAGLLCGLAGAYLSTAHGAGFVREMSAGKGFLALAALIFGRWKPLPVLFACLLFGLLDTVAPRLQGVDLPLIGPVPVSLVSILPYAMTVVLLAGFFGRAIAPRALGRPFVKEHQSS